MVGTSGFEPLTSTVSKFGQPLTHQSSKALVAPEGLKSSYKIANCSQIVPNSGSLFLYSSSQYSGDLFPFHRQKTVHLLLRNSAASRDGSGATEAVLLLSMILRKWWIHALILLLEGC